MTREQLDIPGLLELGHDEALETFGGGGLDLLIRIGKYVVRYSLEHIGEFVDGVQAGYSDCGCQP